jgi:uncharacterized protein
MIEEAMEYIRRLFEGNSDGHDFAHTMRVYRNAMEIADSEPECDRMVVALGALLHDADDGKLFGTEHNEHARAFLSSQGVEPQTAEKILSVINDVSFSKNRDRKPGLPEGCIVRDADRLDAIGAVGIARTFAYGGKHGRGLQDSIAHFHEKLLLLKDMMLTEKAKEIAESRHQFMIGFLRQWEKETGA